MPTETQPRRQGWRILGWGGAAGLLALPLVARAPWTLSDYLLAGGVLAGIGLLLEVVARAPGSLAYRAGAALAVLAAVGLFWVNGAVGFLGDEGNPANLMFFGVIAIAVAGCVIAGFHAAGMARAMYAAAGAQVLVAVIALVGGLGSPGEDGLYEAVMGTTLFAGLWLISGGLLQRAAREEATQPR